MMSIYTVLLRQGVSPSQLDDTDLEDWFYMFGDDTAGQQPQQYIDDIMR
jgi:hypothetical protein|nr:MAG TPA: hypothetical protein [Caudoviricetes sp.]